MSHPVMGEKRQCLSCAAKFFDLSKNPILCPKCGATFEPVILARAAPRRSGRVFASSEPAPGARAEAGASDERVEADEVEEEDENEKAASA